MLGLSQQQVADRLSVKPTALSNWENDARAVSIELGQVDEALDGGGTLKGLLWGFGTPEGLDATTLWTKTFPGEASPAWLWIRSPAKHLHFMGEWGVARVDIDLELGPNGLFMTVPVSVPTSPIIVLLSEPGWVDFGRGELPVDVPGAPVISAISRAQRSSSNGSFTDMFFGNMADRFSRSRSRELARLSRRSLVSFFTSFGSGVERATEVPWPSVPVEPDAADRRRFAQLRLARGLSLVDAVQRLSDETGTDVSKDTLRRFETDVGEPHDRLLPVALDHTLGADGQLCLLELRADRGSGAVRVPTFWTGPVWIEFEGSDRDVTVQLTWGDWNREVSGVLPLRLAYHYAEPSVSLRISADPDVSWRFGIGRRDGAVPINQGWNPVSVDVAREAIDETEAALLAALRGDSDAPTPPPEPAGDGEREDDPEGGGAEPNRE